MKATVTILLALTVFSLSTARPQGLPQIPDISKYVPGGLDVTKHIPQVPDIFKLFSGFSNTGPNNYDTSSTKINTGVQTSSNQGSTNSSNKNSAYNVASKTNVERTEVAQDHGQRKAYIPMLPPPPPPPKYE